MSDIAEAGDQHLLDRVYAVLGLFEGDAGRRFEDLLGDLDAVSQLGVLRLSIRLSDNYVDR